MNRLAWPLVGSNTMRALDRHTIEKLGVPGELLMESAGRAIADEAVRIGAGGEIVVVCGRGNNGGDGLVAARHLYLLSQRVRVVLLGGDPSPDAAANLERARAVGVPIEIGEWSAPNPGVLVDAIFGTGLSREIGGAAGDAVGRINSQRAASGALRVVAADMPSGICADTGQELGASVRADVTVALALPKLGLVLEPGRTCAGRVVVANIGIAEDAPGVTHDAELWTRAGAAARLPERPAAGHKGTFGHALVVAGSEGKTGAAVLAAEAAARSGAGLVTIGCPAGLNDVLEVKCTEAMTAPLPDTERRTLAASAAEAVLALAATRDAVALGPGIGRESETQALVRVLAKRLECPLALDADALIAFAGAPESLAGRTAATVLTPHPGEAGQLLGVTAAEINADRVGAARRLAERSGAVVLLKGAGSVTADPRGRVIVNPTGGPALGTGGTGDVLVGIVAAFLAQSTPAFEAAALAAFVHGAAGDRIAARCGDSGLLASDLAAELPATFAALRTDGRVWASPSATRLAVRFPEP